MRSIVRELQYFILLLGIALPAFAEPSAPAPSAKTTKTLGIREQLIQFEKDIQKRLNDLQLEEGGTIDQLDNAFDALDDKKDLYQLKLQWLFIVPGSATIGTALAAFGVADIYPPWTNGLAAAASTFVMLAFFKGFDWYWDKTFKSDIKRSTERFTERAETRLTEVELKVTEVREIPPQQVEKILAAATELLKIETDLDLIRDGVFAGYQKKVQQRTLKFKILDSASFKKLIASGWAQKLPLSWQANLSIQEPGLDYLKGKLKPESVRLSVAKAHARALATLLKQVQKAIVTARSKLDHVQLANLHKTLEAGPATSAASYGAGKSQNPPPATGGDCAQSLAQTSGPTGTDNPAPPKL